MHWRAHSTVATVVEKDGRFLMVEERIAGARVFNQPAGHLEASETLFEAALRETLEETAWRVELTHFLGLYFYRASDRMTYIRHCFVAKPLDAVPGRGLDEGILAAHWLEPGRILAPDFPARSPLVGKAVEDYLAGVRYPLDVIHHHREAPR